MNNRYERLMCLNAAIMMFIAFAGGLMIGMVAVGQAEGSKADWVLAHMEALINAMLIFAVAGCMAKLSLSLKQQQWVAYSLIAMGYCNCLFGLMRGMTGALGYEFNDSLANNITAAAGMLGVPLAIIAFSIIIVAALKKSGA